MLNVRDDAEAVEAQLARGALHCPGCGGRLARHGFATARELRTLSGVRQLRPRRTICSACRMTHVLEPASTVPRLRDTAEVIGAAWQAKVAGSSHRQIAASLDRPLSTVRRWLRHLEERAEFLRRAATCWLNELEGWRSPIEPAGSPLADALEAVGRTAMAVGRRLGPRPPWESVVALTGGLIASSGPSP